MRSSPRGPQPSRFPTGRNRSERARLLVLTFSLMLVITVMFEVRRPENWKWLWTLTARPSQSSVPEPELMSQANEAQRSRVEQLRGTLASLPWDRVQDNTMFRQEEAEVWFPVLAQLRDTPAATTWNAARNDLGPIQLYQQTEAYRGQLVQLEGRARRAHYVQAPPNNQGIEGYWQLWVQPTGGADFAIVVYALQWPESAAQGMEIDEPVRLAAVLFKRWAYAAADGPRVAPLLLAAQALPQHPADSTASSVTPAQNRPPWLLCLAVVLGALWLSVYLFRQAGRKNVARSMLCLALWLTIPQQPTLLFAQVNEQQPPTPARRSVSGSEHSDLVPQLLRALGFGEDSWDAVQQTPLSGPQVSATLAELLHGIGRLEEADLWRAAQEQWPDPGQPLREQRGRVFHVRGRLETMTTLELPPDLARRMGFPAVSILRVTCPPANSVSSAAEQSGAVLVTCQVPQAWLGPGLDLTDTPVACRGVLFQIEQSSSSSGSATPVFAARELQWYPDRKDSQRGVTSELVRLAGQGVDVAQLQTAPPFGKLTDQDTVSFYQLLKLARSAEPLTGSDQLRSDFDIVSWLRQPAEERGRWYRIQGTARRAVRIEILDPYQQHLAGQDHYYEVEVFVPLQRTLQLLEPPAADAPQTDPSSLEPKTFNLYPIVFCCPRLPSGMELGDDIHRGVQATGVYYKLWSYRSQFMEQGYQASPLLIGPAPRPIAAMDKPGPWGGLAIGILSIAALLALVCWQWRTAAGDRRLRRYRADQNA